MFKYRAGQYEDAIGLLKRSVAAFEANPGDARGAPTPQLFLALALHASGADDTLVRDAVDKALVKMDKEPLTSQYFQDRLVIEVALREARQVLKLPIPTTALTNPPATVPATQPAAGK
jgi:hypothetical protein